MSGDIFTVTARGKGYYWHLGGREAKSSAKHPEMPRAGPQSKAYPQHASSATVEGLGRFWKDRSQLQGSLRKSKEKGQARECGGGCLPADSYSEIWKWPGLISSAWTLQVA